MPMKKGHSPEIVSHNIKEMIKAGHPAKQAVAASLASARKYKKMAMGGMMMDSDQDQRNDKTDTLGEAIGYPGFSKKKKMAHGGLVESMEEMDSKGPEDEMRSLNEIREEGEYYPDEVANPQEQKEAKGFAEALKRQASSQMSPENYAMGGLVEGGPEEDERMKGNRPEPQFQNGTEEPEASMPVKPASLEHSVMGKPFGDGLSMEAKEALMRAKKTRRYSR